jgi:hypothetical protein
MASTTSSAIYAAVRVKLDDVEVLGGQVYTDAYLAGPLRESWQELFRALSNWGIQQIRREAFCVVPSGAGVVIPRGQGMPNFSAPLEFWFSPIAQQTTLPLSPLPTADANGYWNFTVTDPTGFANGDNVSVLAEARVHPAINRDWWITVSGSTVSLMGASASALPARAPSDYSGAVAGRLVKATGGWNKAWDAQMTFQNQSQSGVAIPAGVKWQMGMLNFSAPTSQDLLMKCVYDLSSADVGGGVNGNLDGVLDFDDAESFLVNRTAALAAMNKGNPEAAAVFNALAVGPGAGGDPAAAGDRLGGALKGIINREIGAMQAKPLLKSRFRPKNTASRQRVTLWG